MKEAYEAAVKEGKQFPYERDLCSQIDQLLRENDRKLRRAQ